MGIRRAMQSKKTCLKALTLVETAIVVGVMGIILAAIFAAAALVNSRARINQAADELNHIAYNMRNFYAGQAAPNPGCVAPTFSNMANYINSSIFPGEMLTSPGVINNAFNLGSTVSTAEADIVKCTTTSIVVRYTNVPGNYCQDLLVHNSLPGRDTGLTQIIAGGVTLTAAANALPVTPITAQAVCDQAGGPYTVDWYFNLEN